MTTSLLIRPKFVYPPGMGGTTLALTIPQKHWGTGSKAKVGGQAEVPSGAGEAYYVQWSEWMKCTIRFTESEYSSVRAWWFWAATTRGTFTFFPDQDQAGTSFTVYLDAPSMTDGFEPVRMDDYDWVWEFTFTLRNSAATTSMATALPT